MKNGTEKQAILDNSSQDVLGGMNARVFFENKEQSLHLEKINDSFATFFRMYESSDSKLCLFQDDKGHLIAVPTWRLA